MRNWNIQCSTPTLLVARTMYIREKLCSRMWDMPTIQNRQITIDTIAEHIWALLHASGLPKNLWVEVAHHVVWLLNRTTTKAVEGMTPFEAGFGKKPHLGDLREWGEKVYVWLEKKGLKLGGRVQEGCWLGVDGQSKGVQIYWLDTKSITVKMNIYYDDVSASRHEGEDEDIVVMKSDLPAVPKIPEVTSPDIEAEDEQSKAELPSKLICRPTQHMADLLKGDATWTNQSKAQKVFPGVQLPTPDDADAADWAMNAVDEYALAAETTNSEALEPQSLKEAQSQPDWKL